MLYIYKYLDHISFSLIFYACKIIIILWVLLYLNMNLHNVKIIEQPTGMGLEDHLTKKIKRVKYVHRARSKNEKLTVTRRHKVKVKK